MLHLMAVSPAPTRRASPVSSAATGTSQPSRLDVLAAQLHTLDAASFSEVVALLEPHALRTFSPLYRAVLGDATLEECITLASERLWRYRDRYDVARNTLSAWYLAITHNTITDRLRTLSRRRAQPHATGSALAAPDRELIKGPASKAAALAAITSTSASLSVTDRRILRSWLADPDSDWAAALADELAMNPGAIRARKFRMVHKIRAAVTAALKSPEQGATLVPAKSKKPARPAPQAPDIDPAKILDLLQRTSTSLERSALEIALARRAAGSMTAAKATATLQSADHAERQLRTLRSWTAAQVRRETSDAAELACYVRKNAPEFSPAEESAEPQSNGHRTAWPFEVVVRDVENALRSTRPRRATPDEPLSLLLQWKGDDATAVWRNTDRIAIKSLRAQILASATHVAKLSKPQAAAAASAVLTGLKTAKLPLAHFGVKATNHCTELQLMTGSATITRADVRTASTKLTAADISSINADAELLDGLDELLHDPKFQREFLDYEAAPKPSARTLATTRAAQSPVHK